MRNDWGVRVQGVKCIEQGAYSLWRRGGKLDITSNGGFHQFIGSNTTPPKKPPPRVRFQQAGFCLRQGLFRAD